MEPKEQAKKLVDDFYYKNLVTKEQAIECAKYTADLFVNEYGGMNNPPESFERQKSLFWINVYFNLETYSNICEHIFYQTDSKFQKCKTCGLIKPLLNGQ